MFNTKPTVAHSLAALSLFLLAAARPVAAQEPPQRADSVTDSLATKAQKLDVVRVNARRSSGYAPDYSRAATKIPALPRDVPQSLTTVTRALVRDQSMRS